MSSEEVLELSVEETNKLRAKLGLKPLRTEPKPKQEEEEDKEELELSVDATNELRAKLGLAPLRDSSSSSSKRQVIHKPAENDTEAKEAAERIERAKLQRDVQKGIDKTFGASTLADEKQDALSWAESMRLKKEQKQSKSKSNKKTKTRSNKNDEAANENSDSGYKEQDLEGMAVDHNVSDIQAGETTVMTLADTSILEKSETGNKVLGVNEGDDTLENVNLKEQKQQQDGLSKKRQLELGMGRAGGYAGFDDDEFEELGGTLGPSRLQRGAAPTEEFDAKQKRGGFRIGRQADGNEDEANMTDFDKLQQGKAISLEPTRADAAASDFLTLEEEQAEKEERRKKRDGTFKKKKKDKKKKKKKHRKTEIDDGNEDEDENPTVVLNKGGSLLDTLENTAVEETSTSPRRKRRRANSDDEEMEDVESSGTKEIKTESESTAVASAEADKRSKFDRIMDKGNERTRKAFEPQSTKMAPAEHLDEEPDDSFLNAALAKARRLNRLREMNQKKDTEKGANAVVKAVMSSQKAQEAATSSNTKSSGTMTFSVDDTREFTRALRAKAQQKEREQQKAKAGSEKEGTESVVKMEENDGAEPMALDIETIQNEAPKVEDVEDEEAETEEMDINELAKEIKADDVTAVTTSEAAGVGRGLSAFVNMLKTTGEISEKQGREELRGRAKDERNYDNYKPLELDKVVKIGRNATDKDKEFAQREVKLEYRDKHGRLLTTKEAYRDLCHQFHGYGASKKNEEKRLRQIQREQAEQRLASQQVNAARDGTTAGTLGALKATQKATGKAFVVHKTS